MGGLFIETDTPTVPGITAKLHFLVQEGQIRADAVARHAEPGRGLGLRFTAVRNEDRLRLAELMNRGSTFVLIFSRAFCFRRWVRRTKATCRGAGDLDGTNLGFGIALSSMLSWELRFDDVQHPKCYIAALHSS
jgi:hypothetical protein